MTKAASARTTALLFLAPNLAGFLVFTFGPVAFSLAAAFTNWNLMKTVPTRWIWFDNFVRLFHDPQFWLYFNNTIYMLLGMPICIVGSLALAILLSRRIRGVVAYRTLFYLPSFTSGIAMFILWKKLFNPHFGPINLMIEWAFDLFGLENWHAPDWLGSTQNLVALAADHVGFDPTQFGMGGRDAIVIMGIWMFVGGSNMLLYLAGISNIPKDLFEAADIDGAGAWAKFRHVMWPQLAPTTFFIVIMSFIAGLQGGFEQARSMTEGGPAGTTMTLSYYIYTKAFEQFEIGYASAVAWVLFSIIFAITMVNWRYGSRHVNY
jgi:multiple sugar transport system permease protein